MYLPQIVLMIIAILAILLWFGNGYKRDHENDGQFSFPAILLATWIIASALFGAVFYVLRVAGIFDITIERLLFSIILVLLAVGLFTGKVQLHANVTIEIAIGLFSTICLISMVRFGFLPIAEGFVSPWFVFITGYLFPFFVFVFAKNYIVSEKDTVVIFQALFYFGIYLSITAFFEYTEMRQFVFPKYINDPLVSPLHLERARGPFLNAGFNGFGILVGFISGLHLLQKTKGFTRVIYLAALLLFFPAVFFTLTRMIYLGFIITIIVVLRWYKTSFSKWKMLSVPLAIVLIVGITISPRLLSTERREGGVAQLEEVDIRLALLKRSFYLFAEQPLGGIGLAQFIPSSTRAYKGRVSFIEEESTPQFQHNHMLGIATELGILGLLAYLAVVFLILRRLKQLHMILPEMGILGKNICVVIFAIWCVYLNIGMFLEPSNSLFVNVVPFLFAGLADGLYTRSMAVGLLSQAPINISPSPMRIMNSHV